jgi:hypothetical protein
VQGTAVLLIATTLGLGGSASAASGARSPDPGAVSIKARTPVIQVGSEWTFSLVGNSEACSTITFGSDNDFSDDIGDSGIWHGGSSSVRLAFNRGSETPSFSPGLFTGKHYGGKSEGVFGGTFHYKIKMFNERMSGQLVPGADRCSDGD